jgi:predicted LPLAT superfamily acyltransferase
MAGENLSGRSLGSRFQHEIFHLLIRRVGPWAAYLLLYPVVFWYTLKIFIGSGLYPYLRRRFPQAGPGRGLSHAFRLNLSFGRVLVDRAIMGLTGRLETQAPPGALETLDELLAAGHGLLIISAHVGDWQTGLAWLWRIRTPINVVGLPQDYVWSRLHLERDSRIAAPRLIDSAEPAPAMAAAASALLNGEIVAFMADRVRSGDNLTVRAEFLGADISLPGGPFLLAARLGTPLAVVFTWRLGPGRVAGRIFRIIRPERAENVRGGETVRPLAEAFTAALTDFISEYPFQFFNFHDLWSA